MATIDISPESRIALLALLQQFLPDVTVWAFGSRVKGTTRRTSDLDLVVFSRPEQEAQVSRLKEALEESSLPFRVDLLVWDNIPASFQQNIQACYAVLVEGQDPLAWKPSCEQERKGWGMCSDQQRTVRDYVSLQRGTTYKGNLVGQPGPVLLGLASIQPNGGFRYGGFKTYGGECPEKISLRPGDIYVSLKDVTQSGDLLGSVSRIPPDILSGRLTQDTVKLIFDGQAISKDYLYWLLRTPTYRDYCRGCGTGTTTLGLARDDFLNYPVPVPSPADLVLVEMLEGIEDRIALLRETNATLEAIAQALFKSWFVDFDPVHAKARGEQPQEMDEATAALFPDSFEESELGMIPKGWRVTSLDNIAHFLNGLALQKFPPEDEQSLPVIKIAQLRKGDTTGADRASRFIKPEYIIQNGDVLFSWSGSLEVETWSGGEGALNQHLFKVTSDMYPKWFYYRWTKQHLSSFQQIAASKATTMGHIQRKHLTEALVVIPSEDVISEADMTFNPLLNQWINNALQAQTLSQLRDTLLPKLISGQLRLPEAQVLLAEELP